MRGGQQKYEVAVLAPGTCYNSTARVIGRWPARFSSKARVRLVFDPATGERRAMAERLPKRLAAARRYMLLAAVVVAPFARPRVGLWLSA